MKKKIKSGIGILIVVILSFLYAHVDKNTYYYDRNADTSTFIGTGILTEGQTLCQTFSCQEKVLNGMNVKAAAVGDVSNISVEYRVIEEETGKTVASGSVNGNEIRSNKFNVFEIEKLTDTKGKTYTFEIEEKGSDETNGISFYVVPQKEDTAQNVVIKGNETAGALAVRSISHRFDLETFLVLLGFVAFIVIFMKLLYKLFK